MHVLIIFCHPCKQSYTHSILEELKTALFKQKNTVEISDLYAMDFKSDITEQEYKREAQLKAGLPVAEDVLLEHKKIEKADCIIFLYPVWWSGCPAKNEGLVREGFYCWLCIQTQ